MSVDWRSIRSDYESGKMSIRKLALQYGVSKTYLIERRDKENWTRPTADRPLTDRPSDTVLTSKKEKQEAFLSSYSENANILLSARTAGISRQTVYEWQEHDENFSLAFNQAKEDAKDVIRGEIYRRGKEGWIEGAVRKYSDTLLIFHAKMMMPEYRDKQQIDVNTKSVHQDMQAIHNAIAKALEPYPDAKLALADALDEVSKSNGINGQFRQS